jgi:hypothetical protein
MKAIKKLLLLAFAACALFSVPQMMGDSKKAADYPLRVHVYSKDSTTFYYSRMVDESKGEGRGDLFENDDVHGFDFNFACSAKLKANFGYETYPAKWKKPGRVLTVLLPVFGQANTYFTCDLNADVKDFVYTRHQGRMGSEPEARYKVWMAKHDYDPVHGKNTPAKLDPKEEADQNAPALAAGAADSPSSAPPPSKP